MKLIETINTTSQVAVAVNARILLGNIDKSVNQCAYVYNGVDTITLKQAGYYIVLFKADVTATAAAQDMTIGILGNGSTATQTTATGTAIGDTYTTCMFKIVKVGCTPLSLTFINAGTAETTINNVVVSIFKIA